MTISWFQHDTDSRKNRKIRRLLRSHGVTGLGIWWSLLEELTLAEKTGFQITADEFWLEDFADDLKISDYRILVRVFDTLAELNLIDPQLWQEHIILCQGIVDRGDRYIKLKAQNTARKRDERLKKQDVTRDIGNVTQESRRSHTVVHLPDPDPDPDSDPDSDSEKKVLKRSSSSSAKWQKELAENLKKFDDDDERENFLTFGRLKAQSLPEPPTCPDAWINKSFGWLEQLYSQEHDKQFSSSAAPVDPDCVLPPGWTPRPLSDIRTNSIDGETYTVQGVAI